LLEMEGSLAMMFPPLLAIFGLMLSALCPRIENRCQLLHRRSPFRPIALDKEYARLRTTLNELGMVK